MFFFLTRAKENYAIINLLNFNYWYLSLFADIFHSVGALLAYLLAGAVVLIGGGALVYYLCSTYACAYCPVYVGAWFQHPVEVKNARVALALVHRTPWTCRMRRIRPRRKQVRTLFFIVCILLLTF